MSDRLREMIVARIASAEKLIVLERQHGEDPTMLEDLIAAREDNLRALFVLDNPDVGYADPTDIDSRFDDENEILFRLRCL